jgi:methylisocitrate lyase
MSHAPTPGQRLRQAVQEKHPLQVVGAVNAYHAILATKTGYRALYLSGGGVAAASYGLPDLGLTSLDDVLEDVRRIAYATDVPLLVDADTGWGGAFNIARTIRQALRAQAKQGHRRQDGDGGSHQGRGGRPQRGLRHHGPHRRPGGRRD